MERQREMLRKECGADPGQLHVVNECQMLHEKLVTDVQVSHELGVQHINLL